MPVAAFTMHWLLSRCPAVWVAAWEAHSISTGDKSTLYDRDITLLITNSHYERPKTRVQ